MTTMMIKIMLPIYNPTIIILNWYNTIKIVQIKIIHESHILLECTDSKNVTRIFASAFQKKKKKKKTKEAKTK